MYAERVSILEGDYSQVSSIFSKSHATTIFTYKYHNINKKCSNKLCTEKEMDKRSEDLMTSILQILF